MPRTASCPCGALKITVSDAAPQVHACSCHECQKRSGSSFSYTAFYGEADVLAIEGKQQSWTRPTYSGGTHEDVFCPACGGTVFVRLTSLPGMIGVNVGCFAQIAFMPPAKLYWSSQRHLWFDPPTGIACVEKQ